MDDNKELTHHGIKGMKWGDRRFQYKDGSLTDAGRKRYGVGDKDDLTETKETKTNSYSVADRSTSLNRNKKRNKKSKNSFEKSRHDRSKLETEELIEEAARKKKQEQEEALKKIKEKAEQKQKEKADQKQKEKAKKQQKEESDKTQKDQEEANKKQTNNKNSVKDSAKDETESTESYKNTKNSKNAKNDNDERPLKESAKYGKVADVAKEQGKILDEADKINKIIARKKNNKQTQEELDSMDDAQLRKRLERMRMEDEYSNRTSSRMSKGHQFVSDLLTVGSTVTTVAVSALTIAKLIKEIQGK